MGCTVYDLKPSRTPRPSPRHQEEQDIDWIVTRTIQYVIVVKASSAEEAIDIAEEKKCSCMGQWDTNEDETTAVPYENFCPSCHRFNVTEWFLTKDGGCVCKKCKLILEAE